MSITKTTEIIKRKAGDLGFSSCGISKIRFLKEEEKNFEDWLNNGYQGTMNYLNKNFDKRLDPRKLVHGSKSIISLNLKVIRLTGSNGSLTLLEVRAVSIALYF